MRRIEGSNPRPAHQLRVCDSHRTPVPFVRAVFQQAAHLCDSCVVLSKDVARDAEQMDLMLGRPWPWRTYHLVKLHHDSAADEPFDGEAMGRAMAAADGRLFLHSPSSQVLVSTQPSSPSGVSSALEHEPLVASVQVLTSTQSTCSVMSGLLQCAVSTAEIHCCPGLTRIVRDSYPKEQPPPVLDTNRT